MREVTGKYDVRRAVRMHHEGTVDTSGADALGRVGADAEVLAEVMDPQGWTVAYFTDHPLAERFCAWMNDPPQNTPTAYPELRARYARVGSGDVHPATDNYLTILAAIRNSNAVEQCADWLRPDHLALLRQAAGRLARKDHT
jgi:hypothetical protein